MWQYLANMGIFFPCILSGSTRSVIISEIDVKNKINLIEEQTNKLTNKQVNKQSNKQTNKQASKQASKQTNNQANKQT